VSERNERRRLGHLMDRRLRLMRKLAGFALLKTSRERQTTGSALLGHSSTISRDAMLRSLQHGSLHDVKALGYRVTEMHDGRATARRGRPELLATRSSAIRAVPNASKGTFGELLTAVTKNRKNAEDIKVEAASPSVRRHAHASSKVAPQLKATRLVGNSARRRNQKGKEKELGTLPRDDRPEARKSTSDRSAKIVMQEQKRVSAQIPPAAQSSIGRTGKLTSYYTTQGELGKTSVLRARRATAVFRPMAEKSGLAGWHEKTGHLNVGSEGNELEHRGSAAPRNSAAMQKSFRPAPPSTRIAQRRPTLVVNFNPTVVLKAEPDQTAKKNIVEALSRHSHELVQLIESEIAKQRRVEFAS
jgi:hypothetical protein